MSPLHDFFHANNFRGFQRLLDSPNDKKASGAPSTSGGRSWNRPSPIASMASNLDVNSRDWLGRTVLHLSVTSVEYMDYLKALLKHPHINVNLADIESQWTPLHRALYHANVVAARILLQHPDIDVSLKDKEGYAAFDVFNSTINGTKPDVGNRDAELFTWGANRNAALGFGDGNDRAHPDRVAIHPKEEISEAEPISKRFSKLSVKDIQMSKLHTAVITSESSGNLRLCGFGSGGRLGRGQQMQYELNPLPQFEYTIVAVALGQDHTLAITKAGEVLSWGLNRFSQLGYVVETTSGRFDESIQATPKKIMNPFRKEFVIGVAACKTASACWTAEDVYTWGTNHGQLGYDKQAHPTQVAPRKVTKFSQPIMAMALTDMMAACLLRSKQVECIWNDRHSRVIFPVNAFPSEIQPYRPPQAIRASHIAKLTASDDLIAALSSNGEVFTFSVPSDHSADGSTVIRPQRIWALRKKFSSVQDVAIGPDGSILTCTESGHVYLRVRNMKGGGKNFKFQRIPYLQRISNVTANSTGAFGALRVDFKPKVIQVQGNTLAQDLGLILPLHCGPVAPSDEENTPHNLTNDMDDEGELEDADIEQDLSKLKYLFSVLRCEKDRKTPYPELIHGADTLLRISGLFFPAHRAILAARSRPLLSILSGDNLSLENVTISHLPPKPGPGQGVKTVLVLKFEGITSLSLLVLVHYLYSDEVLAIWDRRINVALANSHRMGLKVDASVIKADLQRLARVLDLPALGAVLQAPVKRSPAPTLSESLCSLFETTVQDRACIPRAVIPDVVLELADKDIWTHSVVLRGRSLFFAGLFGSDVWTVRRWSDDGVLRLDFKHMRWHIMQYVLRFMACGEDREMFDVLPFVKTADDVLEFLFEMMAPATELLLDRLLLICSSIILEYLDIHNCCYILAEATHYRAEELVERVQEYMAANMESLLECGILDHLPDSLLDQLSSYLSRKQREKAAFTRTPVYVDSVLAKHWDWLSGEDIPGPIDPSARSAPREMKTKLALPIPVKPGPPQLRQHRSGEELFSMDLQEVPSPSTQRPPVVSPKAWKMSDAPRVDMKALMDNEVQQRFNKFTPLNPSSKYQPKRTPSGQGSQMPEKPSAPPSFPPLQQPSTPTKIPTRDPNSPWRALGEPSPASKTPPAITPSKKAANAPPQTLLGPIITPIKQPSSIRSSTSSGKAWAKPPPEPEKPVLPSTPTKSGPSFADIQRAQEEQLSTAAPSKDKRSLREIQEEEAELQREANFLMWWGAEEERVKEEMTALEGFKNETQQSKVSKKKKKNGARSGQQVGAAPGEPSSSKRKGKGPALAVPAGRPTEQGKQGGDEASGAGLVSEGNVQSSSKPVGSRREHPRKPIQKDRPP